MLTHLAVREMFHLVFLRDFIRRAKVGSWAVKGGVNIRFFFKSPRYSEDMDIDIKGVEVHSLRDVVMKILSSKVISDSLGAYGIQKIVPPDMTAAKQTETTQRFKVHLISSAGEDLFTKIEFSRRGIQKGVTVESVDSMILNRYFQSPLVVPHYALSSTIEQKFNALIERTTPQARDVFDLFILSSQVWEPDKGLGKKIGKNKAAQMVETMFSISYEQFRDTVCVYLGDEDRQTYESPKCWDEIRLKVSKLIEG